MFPGQYLGLAEPPLSPKPTSHQLNHRFDAVTRGPQCPALVRASTAGNRQLRVQREIVIKLSCCCFQGDPSTGYVNSCVGENP